MHEHCLLDASVWVSPPREEPPDDSMVTLDNLGFLRWNFDSLADNLRIDDPQLIAHELGALGPTPNAAVVELTVIGLGRRPQELPAISHAAGVHIVIGSGFYVDAAHPEWVKSLSADQVAELLIGELRDGVESTGIRAGLIGEIGTSNPPTDGERRIVRASGAAAAQTGAAVNLHIDPFGRYALDMVELLLEEAMPADRIVVSHLDAYQALDRDYHRAIAETGAVLEFDNFGLESFTTQHHDRLLRNRSDLERLEALAWLLQEGYEAQIVLGTDVYTKAQLRAYGGCGYDHLVRRILPALERYFGVSRETIEQIMVTTPRRLLDRPALG